MKLKFENFDYEMKMSFKLRATTLVFECTCTCYLVLISSIDVVNADPLYEHMIGEICSKLLEYLRKLKNYSHLFTLAYNKSSYCL